MEADRIVRIRTFAEGPGVMVTYRGGRHISQPLSFSGWAQLHLTLSRLETWGVFEEQKVSAQCGGGFAYNRITSGGGGNGGK